MYHTVSIRFSTNTLLAGGSLAILSRFDAATALDVLRRHRPSTAFLVPTHLQRILQCPGLGADERFDSLRLLAHAGAPCPESVKRATMARVPPGAVWEFYGSTEAQFTVCSPDDWLEHPGSVGRAREGRRVFVEPFDDHAHPADDLDASADDPLDADDSGTIWCDMPDFARFSYWRDEEATRRAWRGTAATVGDLGRLTADGFLFLTGRRHDLIISGGVNVYPAEIENVLAAVAGVEEVAVFGLPDEEWGQRVLRGVRGRHRRGRRRGGPAGRRLGPPGAVQAAQVVHPRRGPAPHGHRQADPKGRSRAPRPGRSRSRGRVELDHALRHDEPGHRQDRGGLPRAHAGRGRRAPRPRRGRVRRVPDDELHRARPPSRDRGRVARGRGARPRPRPHHRDGQDVRLRQGGGLEVRRRVALVRRARGGAVGRRAHRDRGVVLLRPLPAHRAGPGDHALELPAVAGHPLRRARP